MMQNEITASNVIVTRPRFEHLYEALGIGNAQPRLSWIVESNIEGWLQSAYELEAYSPAGIPFGQTGWVESRDTVLVAWPFTPLTSRQSVNVRVRVRGTDGLASPWSEPATVEAALLDPSEWKARFIRAEWDEDPAQIRPGPLLRSEFDLQAGIRQARLYITALGVYEPYLNGAVVGDHVLAPGWTSYPHRLRYQTFDVTELVHEGRNAIGAMLGDGWFRGRLGWGGGRANIYGERIALLAQLEVEYTDGRLERIATDETWRSAVGPILANDIYDGEEYDARREKIGWATPGYDDRAWEGVKLVDRNLATLFAPVGPPVRRTEILAPVSIFKSPSGRTLVDFGQNLVGWLRLTVSGEAGQTITLRHAEVLEHSELGTRPLRHARATDKYTLRGDGVETWEPRFTFHGFRYAEVDGWPGELKADNLRAVVCHSDMERTGWFDCSDPLINRLHENSVWSMRGNFLDIPTDCPQRDERLGWTGDIQFFSPTACFLFDSAGFLASWLADLAVEQKEFGAVPFVVPNLSREPNPPGAAWGDAAVFIPWTLYHRFGDVKILADQFESMRAWVDLLDSIAGERHLWDQGFQFGDWLDPSAPPDKPGKALTSPNIIATGYFARSAELVGQAAGVLGLKAESEKYLKLASEVRQAFNREYVTPAGRMMSDAPTGYSLALQFDLLPSEAQRQHAGKRLAALARASGYHISTGFVGTPLICDALCSVGLVEDAFRLLTTRDCPSWLYPVTMGATTIWERWDSMLPDGTINPGEMTSFNHYALGAVADWIERTLGGLAPAAPGYRRIEIKPQPGAGLSSASAHLLTPYGMAACAWKIDAGTISVEIEVPANASAQVTLPGKENETQELGSGKYSWSYPYQPPTVELKPLSLDSTIGDLIDDSEALELVTQIYRKHGNELDDSILSQETRKLNEVRLLPRSREIMEDLEKALSGLKR